MNHDRYEDSYIRAILAGVKSVAVVGASTNPARASNIVVKYLLGKKYRVYPVNPIYAGQRILGQTCYPNLADLPEPVDAVDIFRRIDAVPEVVEEALKQVPKPKVIWLQLTLRDDATAARAEVEGVKVVMNRCMKIEYGRLSGEIAWFGVNTNLVTNRRPLLSDLPQNLDLGERG